MNVIGRLPKVAQKILVSYESYNWSKDSPALPTLHGLVAQPTVPEECAGDVPASDREAFLALITNGFDSLVQLSDILKKYPGLVYCKTPNECGVIAHALFLSKLGSPSADKAVLVKSLILAGAPIDMVGLKGWSALHLAAMKNDLFATTLLLMWGADTTQKDLDGKNTTGHRRKTRIYVRLYGSQNGRGR